MYRLNQPRTDANQSAVVIITGNDGDDENEGATSAHATLEAKSHGLLVARQSNPKRKRISIVKRSMGRGS
jgi:hypothetical protein